MEHDEAIRAKAAERYAAGALSAEEQNRYEEHYFDCPECAEDVRFELTFAANARAALRQTAAIEPQRQAQSAASSRGSFWKRRGPQWVLSYSLAANLVLAVAAGYLLLSRNPRVAPHFTAAYFAPGPTHGAGDIHAIPSGEDSYVVRFPNPGHTGSFTYDVLDSRGRRESSGSMTAPPATDDTVYFRLPLRNLPAGIHTLTVRLGSSGEIISWSRFQKSD